MCTLLCSVKARSFTEVGDKTQIKHNYQVAASLVRPTRGLDHKKKPRHLPRLFGVAGASTAATGGQPTVATTVSLIRAIIDIVDDLCGTGIRLGVFRSASLRPQSNR